MSCYHPLILINTSDMTDPQQRAIVEKLKLVHKHDEKIKSVNTILIPREIAEREGITLRENNAVVVPCGRCIGCRLDYSRQWAMRCDHEAKQHEYNYFLSLTYDDDHLPIGSKGVPTLIKDELSAFMKRFRTEMSRQYGVTGIRFFGCAEYGEKSLRPHYHIILFNCPLPDLQERHPIPVDGKIQWIKQYDSNGEQLLYSPLIGDCWNKGTAEIGQVTFESCAYVARYIVKKQYGDGAKMYADAGVIPEYVRMSRRPGIGFNYYDENLEKIYLTDNINFKRGEMVFTVKPGKYADKLLKNKDEAKYYDIKKKRHQDFYDGVDCKTYENVDLAINNHKAEDEKLHQIKQLKRCL